MSTRPDSPEDGTTPKRQARGRPGPRTAAGKARVRTNAIRHGLTSAIPVVIGEESVEDWQQHRDQVYGALRPGDDIEALLVDRVASRVAPESGHSLRSRRH